MNESPMNYWLFEPSRTMLNGHGSHGMQGVRGSNPRTSTTPVTCDVVMAIGTVREPRHRDAGTRPQIPRSLGGWRYLCPLKLVNNQPPNRGFSTVTPISGASPKAECRFVPYYLSFMVRGRFAGSRACASAQRVACFRQLRRPSSIPTLRVRPGH
jgi:hypothetical protein